MVRGAGKPFAKRPMRPKPYMGCEIRDGDFPAQSAQFACVCRIGSSLATLWLLSFDPAD